MTTHNTKEISISLEAIKRHSKRLLKNLEKDYIVVAKDTNKSIALHDAQEIFAKSLGCNNWHELNEIIKKNDSNQLLNQNEKNALNLSKQDDITTNNLFNTLDDFEIINILIKIKSGNGDMWDLRANSLLNAVIPALVELRNKGSIIINMPIIIEYFMLENIVELYKRKDLSEAIKVELKSYLFSLPGFKIENETKQYETTLEQHSYIAMQLQATFNTCKKFLTKSVLIYDKNWEIFNFKVKETNQLKEQRYQNILLQIDEIKKDFLYENELWISNFLDKDNYPTLNDLFSKNKSVLTIHDLILSMLSLNIMKHEIDFILKLIQNIQRVEKISNDITERTKKTKELLSWLPVKVND
jgi:hypothetical protein